MKRNNNLGTADISTTDTEGTDWAELAKTVGEVVKNIGQVREWFRGSGNKDNTAQFPGGWVEFWKYFPGQPLHNRAIVNTPVTIGYMRQYEKDLFADGVASAAGITDYAMMESLFKQYGPKYLNDSSVNKSWGTFWKALVTDYKRDTQALDSFNTGDTSSGPNTAQVGGILVGVLLFLVAANSIFKPTQKQVNN